MQYLKDGGARPGTSPKAKAALQKSEFDMQTFKKMKEELQSTYEEKV